MAGMPLTLPVSEYCQNSQLLQPVARFGQVTPQFAAHRGSSPKAVELTLASQKPNAV